MGISDLYREYFDNMADVRDRESVTGDHCVSGSNHFPDQHGETEICVDHRTSHVFCRSDDGDSGSANDQEYLLATDDEAGPGVHWLSGYRAGMYLHRGCDSGRIRCDTPMDRGVERGSRAGGGVWATVDCRWGSKDGVLLGRASEFGPRRPALPSRTEVLPSDGNRTRRSSS